MLKNKENNKVTPQIFKKNKNERRKQVHKDIYNDLNEVSFQLSLEKLNAYYIIKEAPNKIRGNSKNSA